MERFRGEGKRLHRNFCAWNQSFLGAILYKIITHGKARRQNNKGNGDDSGKYSEEKGSGDSGTEGGTSDEGGSE